ncbi:hypothetical protein EYR36_004492 [Pleurotus pulmonarius]|nr:hypothetical protein EYR36_004492 [Pleurotus pulmonarius]
MATFPILACGCPLRAMLLELQTTFLKNERAFSSLSQKLGFCSHNTTVDLVASGDPFDTSVLLWTRALPISEGPTPDESVPVCVAFKISRSPTLAGRIIDSGEAFTTFDVDFTVKVEATGLQPDTKYFFQFSDCTNPKTDDHEVSDQAWKAGTADSNDTAIGCSFSPSGACFTDRKLAAVRAYHEWMPIRQVDPNNQLRIWRNFQIGKLIDLTMLDTLIAIVINSLADEKNRSLMGADQEQWFFKTLTESKKRGAIWRIIGQQIVFTQLDFGGFYPNDTTSYNPITGAGAIGVEFAGTAVTSTSTFGANTNQSTAEGLSRQLVAANPDLQWSEGFFRGFYTLTVDVHQVKADFFAMRNISIPNLEAFVSASFIVENGANKLKRPVAGGKINAGALKSSVAPRREG